MSGTQYTRRDNAIALGILPLYYLFFNYMLFGAQYFKRLDTFVLATLSAMVLWTPIYFLHSIPALYFRRRFPAVRQTWMRMSLALLVHICMSSVAIITFFYGYKWVGFPGYTFNASRLYTALLIGIAGNAIVNVVHESVYTFERWSQTLSETERFRRANLQSQLEGLKQQVNPHFLFNSLNSLSSLIDDDPERAERFIEELSSVYRYLLQTNTHELTSIQAELRFIESYYHLQRTRYGSALTLKIDVADKHLNALIPPLTLQLLVENAIKHNIVAADQPLCIIIQTDSQNQLRVSNNVQRRQTRVLSNGVGLSNIATKYELLGQGTIDIEDAAGRFTVTLPLLMSQPTLGACSWPVNS
ncbi:sensor histidine kinase [Spirosoma soli]|uniref:Sensor histidine kinase n=1 Tax=Spirosoma soli TaxID=1770529 RepID=A0ABW5LYA9_9BACT